MSDPKKSFIFFSTKDGVYVPDEYKDDLEAIRKLKINTTNFKLVHLNIPSNVKTDEEALLEIRSTLLVNYDKDGRTRAGLVDESDPTLIMIAKVCEYYEDKLNKAQ